MFAARQFGQHITVQDVIALQVRVERQEKPKVESVSFDRSTANVFQAYMQGEAWSEGIDNKSEGSESSFLKCTMVHHGKNDRASCRCKPRSLREVWQD